MDVAGPETNSLRAQGEKHEKGRRLKRDRNNMALMKFKEHVVQLTVYAQTGLRLFFNHKLS